MRLGKVGAVAETQEKQRQDLTVLCDPERTQVPSSQVGVGGKTKERETDSRKQKGKVTLTPTLCNFQPPHSQWCEPRGLWLSHQKVGQEDAHCGRVFERIISSYSYWEVHRNAPNREARVAASAYYLESVKSSSSCP